MIIKKLYINEFGCFRDRLFEWNDSFIVFNGSNESGKTTLLEFIRRLFCGFPDRRHAVNHYLPPGGSDGSYGGWAELLLSSGETVRLERYGINGKAVLYRGDGTVENDGDEAFRRLTGLSGEWYHRVYAVTVDELTDLAALENDAIRRNLYGAPVMGAGVSLPKIDRELSARARDLVKMRGSNSELGRLKEEFAECRAKLDEAAGSQQELMHFQSEYDTIQLRQKQLESIISSHSAGISKNKSFLQFFRRYRQMEELSAQLLTMPVLPENADKCRQEHAGLLAEIKSAEAEDLHLAGADRVPPVDEKVFREAAALREAANAAALLPSGKHAVAAGIAAILTAALLPLIAAGALWQKVTLPVLAAAGIALIICGISRRKRRCAALTAAGNALSAFRQNFDLPPELESGAFDAHLRLLALSQQILLRRQRAAAALQEFYTRFKVTGGEDFEKLCAAGDRRRNLEEKIALCRRDLVEQAGNEAAFARLSDRCSAADPAAAEEENASLEAEIARLRQEMAENLRRSGTLQAQISAAAKADPDAVSTRLEGIRGDIRRVIRDYLVLRGAADLLELAVSRYEKESQPEVIRRGGELFTTFTGGRYNRLRKAVATGRLTVSDGQDKLEKEFTMLSRGTREQLMLAMRLALIGCREEKEEPLPLILDDVTVDFDPVRTAAVMAELRNFAAAAEGGKRQVFFFTCRDL